MKTNHSKYESTYDEVTARRDAGLKGIKPAVATAADTEMETA